MSSTFAARTILHFSPSFCHLSTQHSINSISLSFSLSTIISYPIIAACTSSSPKEGSRSVNMTQVQQPSQHKPSSAPPPSVASPSATLAKCYVQYSFAVARTEKLKIRYYEALRFTCKRVSKLYGIPQKFNDTIRCWICAHVFGTNAKGDAFFAQRRFEREKLIELVQ